MPGTWEIISKEILGYVPQQKNVKNERYVAIKKISKLLKKGWSPEEVALIWNTSLGGEEVPRRVKGINALGVPYDSPAYAARVVNRFES